MVVKNSLIERNFVDVFFCKFFNGKSNSTECNYFISSNSSILKNF